MAPNDVNDPSSPVCFTNEAGDEFLGYATAQDLIVALNELLEAERAGAGVAAESAGTADAAMGALLSRIAADEAKWCAMLHRWVTALGGAPSGQVGAFYGKAMAKSEGRERLSFLNRGQAWVVRKLQALMPQVRDDRLHADLRAMLRAHETNIDLANTALAEGAAAGPARIA